MWIEVKTMDATYVQRQVHVQPYAADLHLTDRMVRLGTFTRGSGKTFIAKIYKESELTHFESAEDAAYAIAEYQMGAEVANLIPMHLGQDVPH